MHPIVRTHEDKVWETALKALSGDGRLARFYKLPRHEMSALVKIHGLHTPSDIAQLLKLSHLGDIQSLNKFVGSLAEPRIYLMLLNMGRGMKCWIETETLAKAQKSRWTIATA